MIPNNFLPTLEGSETASESESAPAAGTTECTPASPRDRRVRTPGYRRGPRYSPAAGDSRRAPTSRKPRGGCEGRGGSHGAGYPRDAATTRGVNAGRHGTAAFRPPSIGLSSGRQDCASQGRQGGRPAHTATARTQRRGRGGRLSGRPAGRCPCWRRATRGGRTRRSRRRGRRRGRRGRRRGAKSSTTARWPRR